ncbi:MAG: Gfo/Idh/MocA family oxidoreductase [Gemmatimonadales bacterium]
MALRSRRDFLAELAAGSAAAAVTPTMLSAKVLKPMRRMRWYSANDQIQLAVIGAGGMGTEDVKTVMSIEGVRLIAACDLYDGRLDDAQEKWGEEAPIDLTKDYREVLARDDIDAIIVATPDHWHRQITIEALEAGKGVYCEKPMVHRVTQGHDVISAQERTGKTLQVGSQGMSSLGNEKAKELYEAGAIGVLNYAEGFWARNSPGGAWQYEVPDDASEETVDWERFLGDASDSAFDPLRFFRWRNYRDYGTGVAGDLFVHLFSSLHFILGSMGPDRIVATGGLRFWKDGRDVADVVLGMFDYPETNSHPVFNLSLRVNFVDGTSGNTVLRLVGSEGSMDITWTEVILRLNKKHDPLAALSKEEADERTVRYGERKQMLPPAKAVFKAESGYEGAHVDHFINFFEGVRTGAPVAQDATFGFRAAAPALLCNDSLYEERPIGWDPDGMKEVDVR